MWKNIIFVIRTSWVRNYYSKLNLLLFCNSCHLLKFFNYKNYRSIIDELNKKILFVIFLLGDFVPIRISRLVDSVWPDVWKKNRRNLAKSSQKNCRAKKCQNIYIKANFKVRNTYNKAIVKTQNTYNKAGFKTAYLGENWRLCQNKKVAQNIAIFFGYFFQKKIAAAFKK